MSKNKKLVCNISAFKINPVTVTFIFEISLFTFVSFAVYFFTFNIWGVY